MIRKDKISDLAQNVSIYNEAIAATADTTSVSVTFPLKSVRDVSMLFRKAARTAKTM